MKTDEGVRGFPARQPRLSRSVGFEGCGAAETWGCQRRRGSGANRGQGRELGGQNAPALPRDPKEPRESPWGPRLRPA